MLSNYRNADILTRRKYVELIESVKNAGGTAHIFSSMHVSGERMNLTSDSFYLLFLFHPSACFPFQSHFSLKSFFGQSLHNYPE
jgi:hypothetical protein